MKVMEGRWCLTSILRPVAGTVLCRLQKMWREAVQTKELLSTPMLTLDDVSQVSNRSIGHSQRFRQVVAIYENQ